MANELRSIRTYVLVLFSARYEDLGPSDPYFRILESSLFKWLVITVAFLYLQEIKLSTMKSKPQEEIAENEQEMAAAVINAAKKTLISQVVKRNVIENIVPIVISLKHLVGET